MGNPRNDEKNVHERQRVPLGNWRVPGAWRVEAGRWIVGHGGASITGNGSGWASMAWRECDASVLQKLTSFVIEATVSGSAQAAGISFGHYKDFLSDLDPSSGERRLELEVDVPGRSWAFRVDGRPMGRRFWDSAVRSVDDLLSGTLRFKATGAKEVRFRNLAVRVFDASCRLSVIMTCHRFLQRMRLSLRNWCHQTLPSGTHEVLIVNPGNPDGTREHIAAVATSYPHVRVREIPLGAEMATHKSAMINTAVKLSRGEWIWLADADCLFSPSAAERVLARVNGRKNRLFYVQRRHLSASETHALLAGRTDGLTDFEAMSRAPTARTDNGPYGYTQIVHRSTLERIPYPEEEKDFSHGDVVFAAECRRHHVYPEQVKGVVCLHLDHPFAWRGTKAFL